jgi:putative spermidine/putrescine transport system permease protein
VPWGLLRWRLEQLEATTPSRTGRGGLKPGKKAPDFTLPCVAGGEVSLHDFAGRRVFLVFTMSGCKLLSPILYACWVSFTPGELLVPPTGDWSLRWYRAFFGDKRWMAALANRLAVAGLSVTGSLLAGLPLAFALARFHFRGRSVLGRSVLLPLAVPPVVLGVGLLPELYALGLWCSPLALALAHTLLGLPLVCVLARTALEAAGSELESVARDLGATPWKIA